VDRFLDMLLLGSVHIRDAAGPDRGNRLSP
jgi:hypothetical protein